MLRRSRAWEWRAIGSWCLELVSVVAWGELRLLDGMPGALVRPDLVPCGVILHCALLRVFVTVKATSRLSRSRDKRARFGKYRGVYFWMWMGVLVLSVVRVSVGFRLGCLCVFISCGWWLVFEGESGGGWGGGACGWLFIFGCLLGEWWVLLRL